MALKIVFLSYVNYEKSMLSHRDTIFQHCNPHHNFSRQLILLGLNNVPDIAQIIMKLQLAYIIM